MEPIVNNIIKHLPTPIVNVITVQQQYQNKPRLFGFYVDEITAKKQFIEIIQGYFIDIARSTFYTNHDLCKIWMNISIYKVINFNLALNCRDVHIVNIEKHPTENMLLDHLMEHEELIYQKTRCEFKYDSLQGKCVSYTTPIVEKI